MNSVLTAVTAVLGVIAGLGVAYAVFTSARVSKTIELYKLENEAQGKRIKTLEEEDRAKAERLAAVERENLLLRDLATGRTATEELGRLIHQEHVEILEAMRKGGAHGS